MSRPPARDPVTRATRLGPTACGSRLPAFQQGPRESNISEDVFMHLESGNFYIAIFLYCQSKAEASFSGRLPLEKLYAQDK